MKDESRSGTQPILDVRAVARRIERVNAQALIDHVAVMNRLYPEVGAAVISVAGGVASFVGADMPVSYAVNLGLTEPVAESDILTVRDFFRSRAMAPRVDVCPLTDKTLFDGLRKHGFGLCWFVNVLARTLAAADEIPALPKGVSVREVSPDDAELWVCTVDAGFSDGKPMTDSGRRMATMLFHYPRTVNYLAELNGKIAGAGALSVFDGYAAFTTASVLPDFRKRGVQAALIRTRLTKSRELGCDLAGIFALPGSISQRNAERHAFRLMYSKAILKAE